MILSNLRLQNYKNYTDCSFKFSHGLNFIYGNNGNGKTNLLEAISFLCYTRSFLQNAESDCVKYNTELFDVNGSFVNGIDVSSKVGIRYSKELTQKSFTLNAEPVGRLSEFFGSYPLVVLSPQDMKLTMGVPADRRRNFDLLISQISRLYFDDLKSYTRVIKQKNALLKDNLTGRRYSPQEMIRLVEPWNDELIELGSRLVHKRLLFVAEFLPYIKSNFLKIVGNAYEPDMQYESEIDLLDDIDELKMALAKALGENYQNEIKRGLSLVGPHKDNYLLSLRKTDGVFDVRTFASQGEHKTYIVSLKFAEYNYLNDKLSGGNEGEPIVLLDDVFSDLDKSRIERICSILPELKQIFLTTTNYDYVSVLKQYFDRSSLTGFKITDGRAETDNFGES